jgi:hypothetical protein
MTISNPLDHDEQTKCSGFGYNCPYWRALPLPIEHEDGEKNPLCLKCFEDYRREGIVACYSYTNKSIYDDELARKRIEREQQEFEQRWK